MPLELIIVLIVTVLLLITVPFRKRRSQRPVRSLRGDRADELSSASNQYEDTFLRIVIEKLNKTRDLARYETEELAFISMLVNQGFSHQDTLQSFSMLENFVENRQEDSRDRIRNLFKPFTDSNTSIHDDPWFHLAFLGPLDETKPAFPGRNDVRDYVMQTNQGLVRDPNVTTRFEALWNSLKGKQNNPLWILPHIHTARRQVDEDDKTTIQIVCRFGQDRAYTYEWALVHPKTETSAPVYVKLFRNYPYLELILTTEPTKTATSVGLTVRGAVCRFAALPFNDGLQLSESTMGGVNSNPDEHTKCTQIGCRGDMCYYSCIGSRLSMSICKGGSGDDCQQLPGNKHSTPEMGITVACQASEQVQNITWSPSLGSQFPSGVFSANGSATWEGSPCTIVDAFDPSMSGPPSNVQLWTSSSQRAQPRFRFCSISTAQTCGGDLMSSVRSYSLSPSRNDSIGRLFDGKAEDERPKFDASHRLVYRYAYTIGDFSHAEWVGKTCTLDCTKREQQYLADRTIIPCEENCKETSPNPYLKYKEHFIDPTFATEFCQRVSTSAAGEEDKDKLIISCPNPISPCGTNPCDPNPQRQAGSRAVYELRPGDPSKRRSDITAQDHFHSREDLCVYGPWRNDATGCSRTCAEGGNGTIPQVRRVLYSGHPSQSACTEVERVVPCNTSSDCCPYAWVAGSETRIERRGTQCVRVRPFVRSNSDRPVDGGCRPQPAALEVSSVASCNSFPSDERCRDDLVQMARSVGAHNSCVNGRHAPTCDTNDIERSAVVQLCKNNQRACDYDNVFCTKDQHYRFLTQGLIPMSELKPVP